jgi:hypothetical protein
MMDAPDFGAPPEELDLESIAALGRLLRHEGVPYEERRAEAAKWESTQLFLLQAEMGNIQSKTRQELETVAKDWNAHLERLLAGDPHRDLVESVRAGDWTPVRVRKYLEEIRKALIDAGTSEEDTAAVLEILKDSIVGPIIFGGSRPVQKTDPVTESIRVIQDIE